MTREKNDSDSDLLPAWNDSIHVVAKPEQDNTQGNCETKSLSGKSASIAKFNLTRVSSHGFDMARWQEEADRIAKEHCDFGSPVCYEGLQVAITEALTAERERIEGRLREAIPRILVERNPRSGISWTFDCPFEVINEKNLRDFTAEILDAIRG